MSFTFLADARKDTFSKIDTGSSCPCCDQYVRRYRRPLTASMIYVLVLIDRYFQTHSDWLHVPSYLLELNLPSKRGAAIRGDWAKLKFWQFIIEKPEVRGDGSPRIGFWKITELGHSFVHLKIQAPSRIWIYNQQFWGFDQRVMITAKQALKKKFHYDDLMAGTL